MPRRGAHTTPSGGTRPPRPPPSREVTVSKALSYILRHAAEREGLKLDENGYANVADLLAWPKLKSLHVTLPELQQIVAENDKQRFTLLRIPSSSTSASSPSSLSPSSFIPPGSSPASTSPSDYLIRASQGHSLPIPSANLLTPLLPSSPSFPSLVVHGTFPSLWPKILASGGLKRMGRTHIHFATGLPGAPAVPPNNSRGHDGGAEEEAAEGEDGRDGKGGEEVVISGMRNAASILVWVDVKRAMEEGGLKWWRSGNGVVLTEGDEEGMVGVRFFRRVVRRGTGEVVWTPEGDGDGDGKGGDGEGGGEKGGEGEGERGKG